MADLKADAALDNEIRPNGDSCKGLGQAANIFVTGGTGLVGTFLLRELLDRTNATVVCLVREHASRDARLRMRQQFESHQLWDASFEERLAPVSGDLAEPLLGMPKDRFDGIAAQADAIFHCGAAVGFLQPYSALRAPNVLGTKEVLRLACRTRDKPVHYVSSTSVLAETADRVACGVKEIREDEEPIETGPAHSGYVQSKWVAEKALANARDRGMPIAVYRPSTIVGNSRTGSTTSMGAGLIRAWLAICAMPADLRDMNLVPIDYVAKAIVHLATRADSLGKVFHLINPIKTPFREIAELLRAHGHPVPQLPNAQWRDRLNATLAASRDMNLISLCMMAAQVESHQRPRAAQVRFDFTNTLNGLAGSAIACPVIDRALLELFYTHMEEAGLLRL